MSQLSPVRLKYQDLKGRRYECELVVKARTFGSPDSYVLTSLNVSKSGLLLASRKVIPFQVNTLLEISIDPHAAALEKPIDCTAKVVRHALENRPVASAYPSIIGVTFTQDGGAQNFERWLSFISSAE